MSNFAKQIAEVRIARAEWAEARTPLAQASAWRRVEAAERALQAPAPRPSAPSRRGRVTLGAAFGPEFIAAMYAATE